MIIAQINYPPTPIRWRFSKLHRVSTFENVGQLKLQLQQTYNLQPCQNLKLARKNFTATCEQTGSTKTTIKVTYNLQPYSDPKLNQPKLLSTTESIYYSWSQIKQLTSYNSVIHGIDLSRNALTHSRPTKNKCRKSRFFIFYQFFQYRIAGHAWPKSGLWYFLQLY